MLVKVGEFVCLRMLWFSRHWLIMVYFLRQCAYMLYTQKSLYNLHKYFRFYSNGGATLQFSWISPQVPPKTSFFFTKVVRKHVSKCFTAMYHFRMQGVLCMWQLVFALCHRLIFAKMLKGCLMVMVNPFELGHGKNTKKLMIAFSKENIGTFRIGVSLILGASLDEETLFFFPQIPG